MRISNTKYEINHNLNIKIVHISDIHYCNDYKLKRLDFVLENIKKIDPNYIFITGDLIDTADVDDNNLNIYMNFLEQLGKICKVIVILGNHDVEHTVRGVRKYFINNNFISKLRNVNNLYLLRNEIYEDDLIKVLGIEINYEYYKNNILDIEKINNSINKLNGKINILLVHDPDVILNNKEKFNLSNIDIILCGHTHGGLMPDFVPGHRGLISPRKALFKNNMRGIYTINKTKLIISSGIVKLSKRSHLSKLNDIFSSNIVTIIL